MVGSAILHNTTYLFFTESKTTHQGCYPGSVLVDLEESSDYIGFSHIHFCLLPTSLAEEERLRSAVRDLVRNIRAKAGDGRGVAWFFFQDHSPPKDYKFPFCYFISNIGERLAKTPKMIEFNGDCEKAPTLEAARFDIGAKLLSLGLVAVDVPADGNRFLHAARFSLKN